MNENKMIKWLQQYDKDTLIELYSQQHFEMIAQLAEKDKEIDRLKNCVMTEEQVRQIMQEGMYKTMVEQFEDGVYDKQLKSLAIEELEKLKAVLVNSVSPVRLSYTHYVEQVYNKINERIKELKGG